jgi:hypothetical protein
LPINLAVINLAEQTMAPHYKTSGAFGAKLGIQIKNGYNPSPKRIDSTTRILLLILI